MSLLPGGALNTLRDLQMRSRIQRKSAGPSSNNKLSTHKPCPHYFCPNVSKFVSSLICPPASQNVPFDSLLSCNYEELPVRTFTLSCLEGFMWKGPAYVPCYQACVKVTSCSKTGSVGIHRDGFRHHQHWPSPWLLVPWHAPLDLSSSRWDGCCGRCHFTSSEVSPQSVRYSELVLDGIQVFWFPWLCYSTLTGRFSNFSLNQNHLEMLISTDCWASPQSISVREAWEYAFLTSAKVMQMLLVPGLHFENHCTKVCQVHLPPQDWILLEISDWSSGL